MRWLGRALAAALIGAAGPGLAHGGGGGGGHGGGGYYYYSYYGGASFGPPAPAIGDTSNIHTIAIVSAVGQTLTLGSVALLDEHADIDIAEMKLDDMVEQELSRYLSQRFTVKDVVRDRAALGRIPNGHFDTAAKPFQDYLAQLPADGIDAFVVVRPDAETGTMPTPGLSLNAPSGLPVTRANYEIDIIDARTRQTITHVVSRLTVRKGTPAELAELYAPVSLKLAPKDTPTPKQRTLLKYEFAKLLAMSLRETVRAMALGVALPEIGSRDLIPIPADRNPLRSVKRVAVISAIGDAMAMDHRGTFFEHKETVTPISAWNLDNEIETDAAAALDKRLTVVPVEADRVKLARLDAPFTADFFKQPIDGLPVKPDIDLYILFVKHKGLVPGVLDEMTGAGMWNQKPFGDENTRVFASYAVLLVNPKTLRIGFFQLGATSPDYPISVPDRLASNGDWPADGINFTPEQAKTVHDTLSAMMHDSVPETLFHMMLTGTMVAPPPGEPNILTLTAEPSGPEMAPPPPAPTQSPTPQRQSAPPK